MTPIEIIILSYLGIGLASGLLYNLGLSSIRRAGLWYLENTVMEEDARTVMTFRLDEIQENLQPKTVGLSILLLLVAWPGLIGKVIGVCARSVRINIAKKTYH